MAGSYSANKLSLIGETLGFDSAQSDNKREKGFDSAQPDKYEAWQVEEQVSTPLSLTIKKKAPGPLSLTMVSEEKN